MSLNDLLAQFHASFTGIAIVALILTYVLARGTIHALDTALRIVGFVGGQIRGDLAGLRKTWDNTRAILRGERRIQ